MSITLTKYPSKLALTSYHLLLSIVISVLISAVIYFIWYPNPLHQALGVMPVTLMMIVLNLIVAPLLTFIVYKADKKELTRDVIVIVVLQIAALGYGIYIVEAGRPTYIAFAADDFEVVRAFDNEWAQNNNNKKVTNVEFLGVFEKPKFVHSTLPFDKEVKSDQQTKKFNKEMFATKEFEMQVPTIFRTDSYQPIGTAVHIIQSQAKPLNELTVSNNEQIVEAILRHYPNANGWLPLRATVTDMVVLIDKTGNVINIVDLRP